MILKVLGVVAAIWLAFIVVGAIVHAFWWLIIIGAIAFVATAAISRSSKRKEIR